LGDALRRGQLKAGEPYRCRINGFWLEIRELTGVPQGTEPDFVLEDEGKIDAWVELPPPAPVGYLQPTLGELPPPDMPEIPADEDLP
jgi:hypothetical protein